MNQTTVSGFTRSCPGNDGSNPGTADGQYWSFWFNLPEEDEKQEGKDHNLKCYL